MCYVLHGVHLKVLRTRWDRVETLTIAITQVGVTVSMFPSGCLHYGPCLETYAGLRRTQTRASCPLAVSLTRKPKGKTRVSFPPGLPVVSFRRLWQFLFLCKNPCRLLRSEDRAIAKQ